MLDNTITYVYPTEISISPWDIQSIEVLMEDFDTFMSCLFDNGFKKEDEPRNIGLYLKECQKQDTWYPESLWWFPFLAIHGLEYKEGGYNAYKVIEPLNSEIIYRLWKCYPASKEKFSMILP